MKISYYLSDAMRNCHAHIACIIAYKGRFENQKIFQILGTDHRHQCAGSSLCRSCTSFPGNTVHLTSAKATGSLVLSAGLIA